MFSSGIFSVRTRLAVVVGVAVALAFLGAMFGTLKVLENTLEGRDRQELQSELQNLLHQYEEGGLRAVREEVEVRRLLGRDRPFFARVATAENETLLANIPNNWRNFEFDELAGTPLGQLRSTTRLDSDERDYSISIATGVAEDGRIVQVGLSTKVRQEVVAIVGTTFATFLIPCVVAIIALLAIAIRRVLRPVSDLASTVREVLESGDYSRQVTTKHHTKETDELIALFNTLMSTVDSLVENLRRSLDSLAHDIRTPITRIRAQMELSLLQAQSVDDYQRIVSESLDETSHIISLVRRFLDASEAESGTVQLNREPIELEELIAEVVEAYRLVAEEKDIEIEYAPSVSGTVEVDVVRFRQALSNLLDNAVKFSSSGSSIAVRVQESHASIAVAIEDGGPGLPEDRIGSIWSYRFRGSHSPQSGSGQPNGDRSSGYGLGLTIARSIAVAHGGSIDAWNAESGGAVFVMTIPYPEAQPGLAISSTDQQYTAS